MFVNSTNPFIMKLNIILIVLLFSVVSTARAQQPKVLVYHKTAGFHHESIPKGIKTIEDLGMENNFLVEETDDSQAFSEANLNKYDLVIFLNTTGDVLDLQQQKAFEGYIDNGGNFFGIHAAADTEFGWEWYGDLVGAYFMSHPKIQEAEITVMDTNHPTVAHFERSFRRTDEWYNYKDINPEINVLLNLEESSYEGGENGKNHPIAWYQELSGGGRAIYTGGGHTIESYDEPEFREHLRRSILFALGNIN